MGHQINFYLSPKDVLELEKRLLSVEKTLILHSRSRGPYPRIVDSTDLVEDGHQQNFFNLVRIADLDSVVTKEIKNQGYWSIDELRSPVIEFTRSNFDGALIRRGRLYYIDVYYDDSGKLVGKTLGFDVWAKKVLSKARRSLEYDKELLAYIGAEANEMRKNSIKFAQF